MMLDCTMETTAHFLVKKELFFMINSTNMVQVSKKSLEESSSDHYDETAINLTLDKVHETHSKVMVRH